MEAEIVDEDEMIDEALADVMNEVVAIEPLDDGELAAVLAVTVCDGFVTDG